MCLPFDDDAVPIGYPVKDMEVVLLDEQGHPVATGEVGEISVRSRYLASGYWRCGKLTETTSSELTEIPSQGKYTAPYSPPGEEAI